MCPAPKAEEEPDPETPKMAWINKPPPSGPLPVDTEYTYFSHTNKKDGAYYCKRPLEGFLGTAMFTHHYICIIEGGEFYHHDPDHQWEKRVSCYGLTHADPSITPSLLTEYPGIIGGPLRGDTLEAGTCKLIKKVGRSCAIGVLQNISKEPVGSWGVGPGLEDCQEWATDVEDKLQDSCETPPGSEDL